MMGRLAMIAVAGLLATAVPAWAQTPALKLLTGAKGGTFFEYGEAAAKFITAETGLAMAVEPSGGSYENIRALHEGRADLALVAMGPGFEAWNNSAAWTKGETMRRLRALFPMYETPFHMGLRPDAGVTGIAGVDGKRVGVGPENGPGAAMFRDMVAELKLKPEIVFGAPQALADDLMAGRLDGFFFGAGVPVPAFQQMADRDRLRLLPLDGAAADALRKHYPYLVTSAIPAGSYKGQPQAVAAVSVWNFVAAREGLSDDAAYRIVKAVMGDPAKATKIHVTATGTTVANVKANTFMPFHPGAVRYFREAGIALAVQ
ncbi:TAXI family TRAP transporter solute-binding subunit [Ferrovibrio terrae]|uniref:TAXI family TRAP transporter solute-binding subunit n=1 Tax=Ferrovibrio terrae TaxID=2594003 RepID=UPI0031383A63